MGKMIGRLLILALLTISLAGNVAYTKEELSAGQRKEQTIIRIAREYHRTHTYSKSDFFVCSDMAIDLWNQLKTQSIQAKIAVGNPKKPNAEIYQARHVWVMAEVESGKWMAIETTTGSAAYRSECNPTYFQGFYFATPAELKRFMELRRDYLKQLARVNQYKENSSLFQRYKAQLRRCNDLIAIYNKYCAGKIKIADQICQLVKEKVDAEKMKLNKLEGRCEQENARYLAELQLLDDIQNKITHLSCKTLNYAKKKRRNSPSKGKPSGYKGYLKWVDEESEER